MEILAKFRAKVVEIMIRFHFTLYRKFVRLCGRELCITSHSHYRVIFSEHVTESKGNIKFSTASDHNIIRSDHCFRRRYL